MPWRRGGISLPESERWIRPDIHVKADYLVIAVEIRLLRSISRNGKKAASADMAAGSFGRSAKINGGNCNVKIDKVRKVYKSTVILDAAGTGAEEEEGRTA